MRLAGKSYEPVLGDLSEPGIHIGKRLRALREVSGLSQAQVAARLNIDESLLSRIEARKNIQFSALRDYLHALGSTLRVDQNFYGRPLDGTGLGEADIRIQIFSDGQLELPIYESLALSDHRDVVFSIKPEYSEKIIEGKKTVELRRRFPMSVRAGTTAYIYATSPVRALLGMAEIGDIHRCSPPKIWNVFADRACVEREKFDLYFSGVDEGYAIELRQARRLQRPVHLSELRDRFRFEPPQSFLYATQKMREAFRFERE